MTAQITTPLFPMRNPHEDVYSGDNESMLYNDSFLPEQLMRVLLITGNFQERLAGANDTRIGFEGIADILDNEHAAQMDEAWNTWLYQFENVTYDSMPKPPQVPKWEVTVAP